MADEMLAAIDRAFRESIAAKTQFLKEHRATLAAVVGVIATRLLAGNKVLFFGNGGSAADAQHLAAEFVNRFLLERPPLRRRSRSPPTRRSSRASATTTATPKSSRSR